MFINFIYKRNPKRQTIRKYNIIYEFHSQKIQKLLQELNGGLLEREEAMKLILLAFFSGKSIFSYGPPGTAKSMIARRSTLAFGENCFFTYLMNRFSTPEEVFGPIDIKALKENKLKRVTKGYLPEANFAFLDEIWKSSPAILNTLLTIINEKIYKDGDEVLQVPLYGLVCASNEFPAPNQGLEAIYDRMLIRYKVLPLESKESFEALLQNDIDLVEISEVFTLEELQNIEQKAKSVRFSPQSLELLHAIKASVDLYNQALENKEQMIYISDRRYKQVAELLKVCALLNDRDEVLPIDLALLGHCLWSSEEDKEVIDGILKEIFKQEVDTANFQRIQDFVTGLESEITTTCYTKAGKPKAVNAETKQEFLHKLKSARKNLENFSEDLNEAYEELKAKNRNVFLNEESYQMFFSSFQSVFSDVKQEVLKIKELEYALNHLEQTGKKQPKGTGKGNKTYTPTTKEQLQGLCDRLEVHLGDIDVSQITDMSEVFKDSNREDFSGIEEWDVSNVTDMSDMFHNASSFNQPIDSWDVSNVTDMSYMFYCASSFNQFLVFWDVSNVDSMKSMFNLSGQNPLPRWYK